MNREGEGEGYRKRERGRRTKEVQEGNVEGSEARKSHTYSVSKGILVHNIPSVRDIPVQNTQSVQDIPIQNIQSLGMLLQTRLYVSMIGRHAHTHTHTAYKNT